MFDPARKVDPRSTLERWAEELWNMLSRTRVKEKLAACMAFICLIFEVSVGSVLHVDAAIPLAVFLAYIIGKYAWKGDSDEQLETMWAQIQRSVRAKVIDRLVFATQDEWGEFKQIIDHLRTLLENVEPLEAD